MHHDDCDCVFDIKFDILIYLSPIFIMIMIKSEVKPVILIFRHHFQRLWWFKDEPVWCDTTFILVDPLSWVRGAVADLALHAVLPFLA